MAAVLEEIIRRDPATEEVVLEDCGIDDLLPLVPLLARLPNMKVLRLARNNLVKLPDDLSSLQATETLDVSKNKFPGLSPVIRGLFSLNALKHLHIDLPYETDEDEIIVSLTELESFNGTPLADQPDDDLPDVEPTRASSPSGPVSDSPAWRAPQPLATDRAVTPPRAGSQRGFRAESAGGDDGYHPVTSWDASCVADVQRVYQAANSVSGRVATPLEFEDYTRNVTAHLNSVLTGEDDAFKRDSHILKAKRMLYDHCFYEAARSCRDIDAGVSDAFLTMQSAYAALLDGYDAFARSVQNHKDRKLEVMRTDMRHAVQEIEQLMAQMNTRDGRRAGSEPSAQVMQELSWLRTENERLQVLARQNQQRAMSQPPAHSPEPATGPWREGSRGQSPRPDRGPSVGRALSLRQLKELIEDIYASKSKFDIRCTETHMPRETMEQHLYTYLNQKYGLKNLILDWAQAIINAVRKYGPEDNDVAVFGKILRNEVDEEFRFVQRQLMETVHELLRVYMKGKFTNRSDEEITQMMRKRTDGSVNEDEWVDIVKYMYNADDSVSIIMRVREVIREKNPPRRKVGRRAEAPQKEVNSIGYQDFVKVLLDFQLQGHERFLFKFVKLFKQYDSDKNGILHEDEFIQVLKAIDPSKTDDEVTALLDLIDPHNNQVINFSECVTFLSSELVKIASVDAEDSGDRRA
eukprot:TRINITY_DN30644_c0_g1_i1.p1 TRINITY_DN30644_c0_g1~~TRINITY_DN30644_c0_g1_i1.p1  ORF type:complete len:709 (+),score=218.55 TRINITY_DN30644_c0_g1_i1:52-2127(+)